MHASPAFHITVHRFGVWRAAVTVLVVSAAAAVAAWVAHMPAQRAWVVWGTLALLVVTSIAALVQAWLLRPVSLRWDTQRWHLGPAGTAGHEPQAGRLAVSVDLGFWMLLHFRHDAASLLHRGTWLPVQRRGHEAAWHALRCTVYCARPVSLPTVAPF